MHSLNQLCRLVYTYQIGVYVHKQQVLSLPLNSSFHRKLKHKFSIQYSTKLESYSLPREGSNHIQVTLLSIQDMIDEDSTALATPYARHEIS